ncbi:MAG: HupE/UreJ family protein [Flavobacterium sp.]|uniref:HupE/UreJ family protein n=1 Tax=Flavobacterium sp. TaxID=239 RepID=UPI003267D973
MKNRLLTNHKIKFLCCIFLFSGVYHTAHAHVAVVDLEDMSPKDTIFLYIKLGFQHIIPLGIDHILFVLSLFLLNPKLKPVLLQATAFTVAHTVTLGLSMYQVINPPSAIVEPIIALSIMYVAMENIISPNLKPSRIGIVFLFGLIHGMGFASVLSNLGLPEKSFLTSLLMFNVGVELGQITIIVLAYFLLAKFFGDKPYYRKYIVIPLSSIIFIIATYWTIERIFFT